MIEQIETKPSSCTNVTKFFQLFILSYLFFYMFPYPVYNIPIIGELGDYYDKGWDFLTRWFGQKVMGLETLEKIEMTGSGDTTFDYVKLLSTAVFSLLISSVIFVFTFRRSSYDKLLNFVTTYGRYYVGLYLIDYGFLKLHGGQFPFPSISRMEQTYGNSSPMGLLWTFMGYSKPYSMFTGLGEILGGTLLLFRRTSVIGSLITFIIMANVALMNFAYDVPVKLFSAHLAVISFFIFYPNLIYLFNFFILNKTTQIKVAPLHFSNKRVRLVRIVLKSLIVIGIPALAIIQEVSYSAEGPNHDLNGTYLTQQFHTSLDSVPSRIADSTRWAKMLIENNRSRIVLVNTKSLNFKAAIDTSKKIIALSLYNDTATTYHLSYRQLSDTTFFVTGKFKSDSIFISFKRKQLKDYPLVNRGFHWINEYPYNR